MTDGDTNAERDDALLRDLDRARERGSRAEIERVKEKLLRPYLGWGRTMLVLRLAQRNFRPSDVDLDEAAGGFLQRPIDRGLTKPLLNVAYDCVESEAKDLIKSVGRRPEARRRTTGPLIHPSARNGCIVPQSPVRPAAGPVS